MVASAVALALVAAALMPGAAVGASRPPRQATVGRSSRNDVSPPLRSIPPVRLRVARPREVNPIPRPPAGAHEDQVDRVRQSSLAPSRMPAPLLDFDGISFSGSGCNCEPPDTNGEVGATQYVQSVNTAFEVFDKETGASVYGPVEIATLWSGFGGVCETGGEGDPVVLYDQLAERWLISQFAGASPTGNMTDECIAVSASSDATGSYYRYDFHLGSEMYDYPKLAIWPDAYYMSTNVEGEPQPFAFDRAKMLAGEAATFVTPGPAGGTSLELPADLDGSTPPPVGAPETFVSWPEGGHYKLYHFHVDWAAPGNSSFALFAEPPAAGFTELCSSGSLDCVPQEGTLQRVDALGNFHTPMFRAAYRNFGSHESLVFNYTVESNGVAAIRWVELRGLSAGTPVVYQESTYQPDTTWRWLGSAAMDIAGDLAIGFSASSSSMHPAIRYAGRLAGDPLNTLGQGEATLMAGAGSDTYGNRWGDYSDLTVDPVDECTFWYTNEYYAASGGEWSTRIGTFRFPTCPPRSLEVTIVGAGTVTSSPAGIDCGATCTHDFENGAVVTLSGAPGSGSQAAEWKGCDTVNGSGECEITMSAARSVTATFASTPEPEPEPSPTPEPESGSSSASGSEPSASSSSSPTEAALPTLAFASSTNVALKPLTSRLNRAGRVAIWIRNANAFAVNGRIALRIAGRVRARTRGHRRAPVRRVRLAVSRAFEVPAESALVLRLRLSRRGRRRLAGARRLRVKASVLATDPAGDRRAVRRRFALRSAIR